MAVSGIEFSVLEPAQCYERESDIAHDAWVYHWHQASTGWRLSVATLGEPGSGKLSLGGFRIAPADRTDLEGYDNDVEALRLAIGMEAKVSRSRQIGVAGPRARAIINDIVGGKCVLQPTADARVGQPRDAELLDFATHCLHDFEKKSGVSVTTGQDLGHGLMSDGVTSSLDYLHRRFAGSMTADTSKPTGEGNFCLLAGMMRALGIEFETAAIGFIGCGNVGQYVLRRAHESGARIYAIEARAGRRNSLAALARVEIDGVDMKMTLLKKEIDALVVNASGGTLDAETVSALCNNSRTKIVCGCENLALRDRNGKQAMRDAGIIYAPTEIGGIMGYLTAVEQYLCQSAGVKFEPQAMIDASQPLEETGFRVAGCIVDSGHKLLFDEAVDQVYAP